MTDPSMTAAPDTSVYRATVQEISAPWLSDLDSYKFTYSAIGIVFDALAEYLRLGVIQRFPGVCQPSALPFIGRDRKILRGFRESDDAYSPRLRHAFTTWKLAGNAPTLLTELAAYFSPTPPKIRYVVQGIDQSGGTFADWWTIDGGVITHQRTAPSNWNWDGQTGQIRFWIIIYKSEGFTPWYWDDGHFWDGGQSWDYTEDFTQNFAYDAHNLVGQWKASGSHAGTYPNVDAGIIITPAAGGLFDPSGSGANYPNGTWDNWQNRAGIPTTFYIDGI